MNQSGKKSGKKMKIVYGPVYPLIKKEEIIKIPSEKAGEKKIVTYIDLQTELEDFIEIQANKHVSEMNRDNIIRRIREDGKVLTGQGSVQNNRNDDEPTRE